ncbi:MAG TPA: aspartate kinase, partial [Thermodesulfobacteriota bacterium]
AGHDVIVVVSAMAGETNRLVALAHQAAEDADPGETDVLLATGEQVTVGLLAIVLQARGQRARSFLGFQVPIRTDRAYGRARIEAIEASALLAEVRRGGVPIVAGFQGIDPDGRVTTLGRGGSDTTGVAIAAALKMAGTNVVCEIYTDVEGVYTTDPNIVPSARKLARVSYEEMLEMASLGAKVLQIRSVEFAKKYEVPIHVRSSFSEAEGTLVTKEDPSMEAVAVSGVTYSKDEAKIAIRRVLDRPGIAAKVFGAVAEAGIVVDMIIQNVSEDGTTDLTFTVPKGDLKKAEAIVRKIAPEIGAASVESDDQIAKVSIVGVGMRSHAGVASRMFDVLAREGINILMISTSEIKTSCVIHQKYTELAVRVLHDAFGLSAAPTPSGPVKE